MDVRWEYNLDRRCRRRFSGGCITYIDDEGLHCKRWTQELCGDDGMLCEAPHFQGSPPSRMDPWQGSLVLGAGGGGDYTTLLLVASGKCRGQVWVVSKADPDSCSSVLAPLVWRAPLSADGSQFLREVWLSCRIEYHSSCSS